MMISPLTAAEENLMKLFWTFDSFYLKDVMEKHPEPKPHQNTVSTYLKILVEKGFLKTEKEGRIFKYSVIVNSEAYRDFLLENLINDYYPSGKEIVTDLMKKELISQTDLLGFIDVKIELKTPKKEKPDFAIAEEILNPKKGKKDKKKKKKK